MLFWESGPSREAPMRSPLKVPEQQNKAARQDKKCHELRQKMTVSERDALPWLLASLGQKDRERTCPTASQKFGNIFLQWSNISPFADRKEGNVFTRCWKQKHIVRVQWSWCLECGWGHGRTELMTSEAYRMKEGMLLCFWRTGTSGFLEATPFTLLCFDKGKCAYLMSEGCAWVCDAHSCVSVCLCVCVAFKRLLLSAVPARCGCCQPRHLHEY